MFATKASQRTEVRKSLMSTYTYTLPPVYTKTHTAQHMSSLIGSPQSTLYSVFPLCLLSILRLTFLVVRTVAFIMQHTEVVSVAKLPV